MKASQHTRGPWSRNIPPATKYPVIFAGRNTHIAQVLTGARHTQTLSAEEIEANCNLIAAAPDLLEALDRLLIWAPNMGRQHAEDWAFARRAAALARGEKPL